MCGLIAVLNKQNRPASQYAYQLYTKQASRGRQGYGYIGIKDGRVTGVHRAKTEDGIKSILMKDKSDMILFHHRFPTSTKNTLGTTHPMYVSNDELRYDYYFAHNGVITNASALKLKHSKLGYEYGTEFYEETIAKYANGAEEKIDSERSVFNDSESLAIELARFIEGLSDTVGTTGGAAFWGISLEKGTNKVVDIFFGKNLGRSLMMQKNKKWFTITSETGHDIEDMRLFTLNYETRVIHDQELSIDKSVAPTPSTYNRYGYNNTISHTVPVTKPPLLAPGIRDYNALQNKGYTYNEAIDTGYPLSEFFTTMESGHLRYVPNKFAGEIDTRVRNAVDVTPKKDKELLEEYAKKLAELEIALDDLYDGKISGYTDGESEGEDINEINQQIQFAEAKIQDYEEKISALGIDEEIVEDILSTARELQSYETTIR